MEFINKLYFLKIEYKIYMFLSGIEHFKLVNKNNFKYFLFLIY